MARPKKEIDIELVKNLASIFCTVEEIAAMVGVSKDTLERRYAAIIKEGKERGKASLRRLQWKIAQGGNASMAIFLGKQYLGQADKLDFTEEVGIEFTSDKV